MSELILKALAVFALWSLAGWIAIWLGLQQRRSQRSRRERERTRTTGRIVEYAHRNRAGGKANAASAWRPVVEFEADRRVYRLENGSSIDIQRYPEGASVEVLYDADDPTRFHLEEDRADANNGRGIVRFGVIWVACACVGVLLLVTLVGGNRLDIRHILHRMPFAPSPRQSATAAPEVHQYDGFRYTLKGDSTAMIEQYTGSQKVLEIPILLEGHLVSGMANMAFVRNQELYEVIVPGHVGSVSWAAFVGCLNLSKVTLREGVMGIGRQAFGFCPQLRDVTLPASLENIADDAFPDDCAARFHVVGGSPAQRYCEAHGFDFQIDGT